MFWFKKKKKYIYKITWRYIGLITMRPATEYVKATDEWNAWKQIEDKRGGLYDISCEYIERLREVE